MTWRATVGLENNWSYVLQLRELCTTVERQLREAVYKRSESEEVVNTQAGHLEMLRMERTNGEVKVLCLASKREK